LTLALLLVIAITVGIFLPAIVVGLVDGAGAAIGEVTSKAKIRGTN
jgi:hypothetical protein